MNRNLELKQQSAYRQIYAIAILGGGMMVLFGVLLTMLYLN